MVCFPLYLVAILPVCQPVRHVCRKRIRTGCGACASCLKGRPELQELQLLLTTKTLQRLQRRRSCSRRRRQAPTRRKLPRLAEPVQPHQAQPLQVTSAVPLYHVPQTCYHCATDGCALLACHTALPEHVYITGRPRLRSLRCR